MRAGVAPRRVTPTPEVPAFLASATESGAFHVGRTGEVRVFIFRDSAARSRVTSALNEKTAAPRDGLFSWGDRPFLIVGQNMAAVMISGTDALRERVQLTLEAGLPMPAKQP